MSYKKKTAGSNTVMIEVYQEEEEDGTSLHTLGRIFGVEEQKTCKPLELATYDQPTNPHAGPETIPKCTQIMVNGR